MADFSVSRFPAARISGSTQIFAAPDQADCFGLGMRCSDARFDQASYFLVAIFKDEISQGPRQYWLLAWAIGTASTQALLGDGLLRNDLRHELLFGTSVG